VRFYRPGDETRIDLQDVRTIDRSLWMMRLIARFFHYRVHGLENVPSEGPALLCLNHGVIPIDAGLLGWTIYERLDRLPRALTDHLVFKAPGMREMFMALGAVAGRHDTADELLRRGNLVIVMPGGAPEGFKSSAHAYDLYWRKRTGFARLAIRQQVPIIPAACIGIDELYTLHWDLFEAGRKIFGVRSLPFGVPWGRGPGIPRRVPLTHWLGAPIHPDVPAEAADDEEAVTAFRDRVTEVMEQLIHDGRALRASGHDGRTR
jgi:1-acyl-sn-glycerol-3-phosphate acyltransferase